MTDKLDPAPLKAAQLIHDERYRQQTEEGYTPAHDDEHTEGQLALLAAAYALSSVNFCVDGVLLGEALRNALACYGWEEEEFARDGFKPKDPIRDLTRAGALILAELERRLRVKGDEGSGPCSACQAETTYTGEHNGDYGVWLCPDHGGKP